MKGDEANLLFAAVTAAAVGFIGGMAWSDTGHSAGWINEYQTLITGALAVAAAFITVNEMSRVDRAQHERHDEMMKLNLRSDRLRARRSAFPYAAMIKAKSSYLLSAVEEFEQSDADLNLGSWTDALRRMFTARDDLWSKLISEPIIEAKDMFGSNMAFTYQSLIDSCEALSEDRSTIDRFLQRDNVAPTEYIFICADLVKENCRQVQSGAGEFSAQLTQLAGYYESGHRSPS